MTQSPTLPLIRIAIVGGDSRRTHFDLDATLRHYASRHDGGRGPVRRLLRSIRAGGVDMVVLLVRWLGHSDFHAVVSAAKAAGLPIITVRGGASQAKREIEQKLEEDCNAN